MESFNKAEFGKRLKKRLIDNELSNISAARLLDVSPGLFSMYCNGKASPPIEKLHVICDRLNVSADYLLGFREHFTPLRDEAQQSQNQS